MPKTWSPWKRACGMFGIGAAMALAMTVGFVTGERPPQQAAPSALAPDAQPVSFLPAAR